MHASTLASLAALTLATAASLAPMRAAAHGSEDRLSPRAMAQLGDARRATAAFHDINAALGAGGYAAQPVQDLAGNTCIDQPGAGAMGVHFVKPAILLDGAVDPLQPEALIYEPRPNGSLRLVGAEYIVFKADWDSLHPGHKPALFGEHFHEVGEGNRYGLPPFYALHVWMWQPNPSGLFNDWNPAVRCP